MNKLCILAAGKGTRNTYYSGLQKALVPVEDLPAISHIFKNYTKDTEIVIVVGYLQEQIRSYLSQAKLS
jgi:NDP-sugar pyrophosphorylase family protein